MNAASSNCRSRPVVAGPDDPATESTPGPADADADPDQPPEPSSDAPGARAEDASSGSPDAPDTSRNAGIEWLDRSGRADDLDHGWIRGRLAEAAARLGHRIAQVDVSVVDDAQMTGLHGAHCGIDETTDVLTFVAAGPPDAIEADIAVCVDEARRRASGGTLGVERELLLYAVHGLLHAAGHDDIEPAAYEAMHAREDEILEAIGVGPVFRGDRSGHADDRRNGSRDDGSVTR